MTETVVPPLVREYAHRTVEYVQRAVGLELQYDSDTLPLLDHYLRNVPDSQPATVELVALTAGAYFGEVVRRRLGGRWDISSDDARAWRMVLPTGLHFSPAGFAAAAIVRTELEDLDTALDAPPRTKPFVEQALARMGEVTEDDFYSLCGRLDTLEHVHEVLVAVAANMLGDTSSPATDDVDDDDVAPPLDEADPTAEPPGDPDLN